MPEELTPAELTLLGLVVERPRYGYELDEVITTRGMREWTEIGFSSIYYLLGKLRAKGLVAEVEADRPRGNTTRRVFAATPEGRRACTRAAEAAIAELRPVFPHVLVGLANQPAIPPDRLRVALDRRAEALTARVAQVRAAAEGQRHAPEFVSAIFDFALRQLAAEQEWLAAYRTTLPPGKD